MRLEALCFAINRRTFSSGCSHGRSRCLSSHPRFSYAPPGHVTVEHDPRFSNSASLGRIVSDNVFCVDGKKGSNVFVDVVLEPE